MLISMYDREEARSISSSYSMHPHLSGGRDELGFNELSCRELLFLSKDFHRQADRQTGRMGMKRWGNWRMYKLKFKVSLLCSFNWIVFQS